MSIPFKIRLIDVVSSPVISAHTILLIVSVQIVVFVDTLKPEQVTLVKPVLRQLPQFDDVMLYVIC